MSKRTFSVMIRKTVQVKQYEPTVVELQVTGECDKESYVAERDEAYGELKRKMNEIFNKKPTASCLD